MSAQLALPVFLAGNTTLYLETAFLLLCSPRTPLPFCYWETVLVMDAGRGQHYHGVNASSASLPSLEKGEYLLWHQSKKNNKRLNQIFGATHAHSPAPAHSAFWSMLHVCLPHECKSQPRLQQAERAGFPLSARTDSFHQLLSGFTKT